MNIFRSGKKIVLTRRQRWQFLGLAAAASGILLISLYWALRVSVLPELVPLLNIPTNSPAARIIAALMQSTPTASPGAPATTPQSIYVPLTQMPDGEQRDDDSLPLPTAASGPSTVYMPLLSVVVAPTPTPVPQTFESAAPEPDWPDSLPGLTGSKLSLHTLGDGDPYIMEFVRRAHPRVIKAVDNVGWLSEVKAASSATVTIGRLSGQDESWAGVMDPAVAAQTYIGSQLERYRLNPGVDYWEGWNEYDPNDDAKLRWYGQFEAERVCQMQALGLRAAVGGFAYGVPEYYEMEFFLPALEAAYRCGGIFTLHEGISSRLNCGIGLGATIPGSPDFSSVVLGHHMLRYRYWYEGYLKPRGLGDLPLVISELAVAPDSGCGGPGNAGAGWKDFRDWWVKEGIGPSGEQAYVNLLAGYDAELRRDSYVWGVTIFTAGASSASDGWFVMDVHDVIRPLAYYAVTVPPPAELPGGYP